MKSVSFSLEESQLIVEALLFTANTDVCSDHTSVHRTRMIDLAKNIYTKFNNPAIKNIYVFKDEVGDDDTTPLIIETFSNIPQQSLVE